MNTTLRSKWYFLHLFPHTLVGLFYLCRNHPGCRQRAVKDLRLTSDYVQGLACGVALDLSDQIEYCSLSRSFAKSPDTLLPSPCVFSENLHQYIRPLASD